MTQICLVKRSIIVYVQNKPELKYYYLNELNSILFIDFLIKIILLKNFI